MKIAKKLIHFQFNYRPFWEAEKSHRDSRDSCVFRGRFSSLIIERVESGREKVCIPFKLRILRFFNLIIAIIQILENWNRGKLIHFQFNHCPPREAENVALSH